MMPLPEEVDVEDDCPATTTAAPRRLYIVATHTRCTANQDGPGTPVCTACRPSGAAPNTMGAGSRPAAIAIQEAVDLRDGVVVAALEITVPKSVVHARRAA
jgi:hypothetical protein